jgi:hypothetical protein
LRHSQSLDKRRQRSIVILDPCSDHETAWWRASRALPSVEATLTALAYDDVSITGGTLGTSVAGGSPLVSVPTDEGKVFGQVIGKLNFDWSKD